MNDKYGLEVLIQSMKNDLEFLKQENKNHNLKIKILFLTVIFSVILFSIK